MIISVIEGLTIEDSDEFEIFSLNIEHKSIKNTLCIKTAKNKYYTPEYIIEIATKDNKFKLKSENIDLMNLAFVSIVNNEDLTLEILKEKFPEKFV